LYQETPLPKASLPEFGTVGENLFWSQYFRFHPDVIDLTDLACSLKRFPRLQGVHLDLRCLADAEPNQEAWKKFGNALKKITLLKTLKFRIMM